MEPGAVWEGLSIWKRAPVTPKPTHSLSSKFPFQQLGWDLLSLALGPHLGPSRETSLSHQG